MDAVVLVGGRGIRLRPLTATRHKSLVPVCNRPLIGHLLEWLARSGFSRAVLALGQENEDLAATIPPGRGPGLDLVHVVEKERLESGGAIRNAVREAGVAGRFAVFNGDVFLDFDFRAALAAHEERRADLTLGLYEVDDPSPYGVAVLSADGTVTGFLEKPPPGTAPSRLVNAGAWIFEPGLVNEIPPGPVRVEETLFPSLVARRRRVLGHRFEGIWADVGVPARYLELNLALLAARGSSAIGTGVEQGAGSSVRLSAVGDSCRLGDDATVESSVLWEKVCVGARAVVRGSILADGVQVGEGAHLEGVLAGSGATIGPGARIAPGTSIEPGERYDASDES